jgi:hypothetical protein
MLHAVGVQLPKGGLAASVARGQYNHGRLLGQRHHGSSGFRNLGLSAMVSRSIPGAGKNPWEGVSNDYNVGLRFVSTRV